MKKRLRMFRISIFMFIAGIILFLIIGFTGSISFEETPLLMTMFLLSFLMMVTSAILFIASGYGDTRINFEERLYNKFKRQKRNVIKDKVSVPKSVFDLLYLDHQNNRIKSNVKKNFEHKYSVKSEFKSKEKEIWISFANEIINITLQISRKHNHYFVVFDDNIELDIENVYKKTNDYRLSVDYLYGVINGEDEITIPFINSEPSETYEFITEFVIGKIEKCNEVLELLSSNK